MSFSFLTRCWIFHIEFQIIAVNYENREGAVGFVSVLFPSLLPLGLIKVNTVTGHEVRDDNGLCIRCEPGEPGGNTSILIDQYVAIKNRSFQNLLGKL